MIRSWPEKNTPLIVAVSIQVALRSDQERSQGRAVLASLSWESAEERANHIPLAKRLGARADRPDRGMHGGINSNSSNDDNERTR